MAVTVTPDTKPHVGKASSRSFFLRFGKLNLGIYASNGVPITPAMFGLTQIVHVDLSNAGGRTYEWDAANSKIKAFRNAAGAGDLAEVAGAVDLSAQDIRFAIWGK